MRHSGRFDTGPASDALQSELIFLPEDGSVARVGRAWRILTPSNPAFWWGNCLHFDAAPEVADFVGWMDLFERHVRAVQPASAHGALAWTGPGPGAIEPFVANGFTHVETIMLAADRRQAVSAPVGPGLGSTLPIAAIGGTNGRC